MPVDTVGGGCDGREGCADGPVRSACGHRVLGRPCAPGLAAVLMVSSVLVSIVHMQRARLRASWNRAELRGVMGKRFVRERHRRSLRGRVVSPGSHEWRREIFKVCLDPPV